MNILILNWRDLKNSQAGGAELYLHEQAKFWVKKGNNVVWFTSEVPGEPNTETIDGIKFVRKGSRMGVYLYAPLTYLKHLSNCDVIIDAENGIPFFSPLFSRKKRVLLIHHIHKDVWFKEFKFPTAHIGYLLETKLMPIIYKKTHIVTVSQSSKDEIKKLMNNNIEIIHNAISKKYKPGKKAKKPEIIFLGRLKRYKSIDILLKAAANVDKNIKINIIGRGDDEKRLKKIAKDLNLENVNFLGFISEKEKIKALQNAWLMVNPSFIEGWSITNIEANACGTPVIGSNVAGIKDSIMDKKTGFLFPYGDEKTLSSLIKKMIKNSKLRGKMSKEAIKWSKNFSWEKSADKFLDLLKNK